MVFASIASEGGNLPPLIDFNLNFMDRQALKVLEDAVTDLQVILPNLMTTLVRIRDECRVSCRASCSVLEEWCDCDDMLSELDEYAEDVKMYVQRAAVLRDRANCTARLVSSPGVR
jgi:hypothetical protein